jgi:flavin reductase (DIM6/NTAB) family NADH-FMN oxidoreductase RutF
MVDEGFVHNMVDCSIGFPSGVSEPEQLKLSLADGKWQPVPHLAGAPVALECRKVTMMNFGAERDLLVGEVLGIQVREGIVDPVTLRTSYESYKPVARIAGTMYARMREHYDIKADSYENWLQRDDR